MPMGTGFVRMNAADMRGLPGRAGQALKANRPSQMSVRRQTYWNQWLRKLRGIWVHLDAASCVKVCFKAKNFGKAKR